MKFCEQEKVSQQSFFHWRKRLKHEASAAVGKPQFVEAVPYNVFHFHESRGRDGPAGFLKDFQGTVKVDAYGVKDGVYLASDGRITASCCLTHARRKFDEAKQSHPRLAAEAPAYFQQLYGIEDRGRELSADDRRLLRQRESTPVLERLRGWLDERPSTRCRS